MFATSFAPFVSEFLFRYGQASEFVFGQFRLSPLGPGLVLAFALLLGFTVPVILPGARVWHKGYNLYNGGLAFGLLGFFLYNLMYETMGHPETRQTIHGNPVYERFGYSYVSFATGLCPIAGCYGVRAGILAGFVCASLCTATSALHGGQRRDEGTACQSAGDDRPDPGRRVKWARDA